MKPSAKSASESLVEKSEKTIINNIEINHDLCNIRFLLAIIINDTSYNNQNCCPGQIGFSIADCRFMIYDKLLSVCGLFKDADLREFHGALRSTSHDQEKDRITYHYLSHFDAGY